jgi:hypothetical protein
MKRFSILCIFLLAAMSAFADGNIDINSPTDDPTNGWTWSSPTLTITDNGTYTITGTTTTNTIKVNSGVNANITLNGVNIDVSGTSEACAVYMAGATVNLTLVGDNTLTSGAKQAGLATSNCTITAASIGSLTARGGADATFDFFLSVPSAFRKKFGLSLGDFLISPVFLIKGLFYFEEI